MQNIVKFVEKVQYSLYNIKEVFLRLEELKMGAKLYKQFEDFHNTIKLDKSSTQLKEKRETLQSDIENKLPDKLKTIGIEISKSDLNFFDQGSYRQGISTGIKCDKPDRDVAVEFDLDTETFIDPRKIKKCVRDALKIENKREPQIKEPCVTVKYLKAGEENIHIDFPIYAKNNGCYYLARGKEFSENYEWEQCDPHGLNTYLEDLFKDDEGNQLRRVVRYLKKWKIQSYGDSYTKDQVPPSIALTLMAGAGFIYKIVDGQDDDLEALYTVVTSIKNRFVYNSDTEKYTIEYLLPVTPYSDVFYKMNEEYQDKFYKKCCRLCEKLKNAIYVTEEYEAAKFLQDVFGTEFKLPPKPNSKTGVARTENSYA